MLRRAGALGGLLLLGAALLSGGDATGCMAVARLGQRVEIAEEEAIIVWDASTKTEHFVRRAAFKTTAKDFGFLVPTPTRPTLAEADDKAFARLAQWTRPLVRTKGKDKFPPPPGGGVVVLEKKRVAGLDAVVLQARDPLALNNWLKEHGYPSRPEQAEWLRPYVEQQWVLTAFKFAGGGDPKEVSTKAVRMSFKTERPFFPYREPKMASEKGDRRLLRVYLVGMGKATGALGDGGVWPGRVVATRKLSAPRQAELLRLLDLPAATLPDGAFVTRFEDRSSPRPGSDEVYFSVAKEKAAEPEKGRASPPGAKKE